MNCAANPQLQPGAVPRLQSAYFEYPPSYDDALKEVRARIVSHGAATKMDLAALVAWKNLGRGNRFIGQLNRKNAVVVRNATAAAFEPGKTDAQRISALHVVPGFKSGRAVCSVLFTAWDPENFGVYDRRAKAGLKMVLSAACTCNLSNLPTYWEHLRCISRELSTNGANWTPRMVDMALYKLGLPPSGPTGVSPSGLTGGSPSGPTGSDDDDSDEDGDDDDEGED